MFSIIEAKTLLQEVFAPWVQDLDLSVEALDEAGAVLCLPFSDKLCREGGVICGQALMSAADTAMVFAVSSASGGYRPMTTVDQSVHFLKPAAGQDIAVKATITRLGRGMAFGQVILSGKQDDKPVAQCQLAYALL